MTKVAQLYEEEKIDAVNEAIYKSKLQFAKSLLLDGNNYTTVMKHTGLTRREVELIIESLTIVSTLE